MKLDPEQVKRVRESLKNRGLLPPEELYGAYMQFWRRPDDDEIDGSVWQKPRHKDPKVRYFGVADRWCHVIPIKTQGTRCWQWDDFEGSFEKPINMDVRQLQYPMSALSAVTHIIMDDKYGEKQVYLQRVPEYRPTGEIMRFLPSLIFRVDCEGCYGWNLEKNDFDVFLEGHSSIGGLYFHSRLEWVVEEEAPVYFRIISREQALLAQKAMDGKCDYYVNPIIGIAYAIADGKYMRWQDDDFTLPMTWGEKALVNRGESVKVCREDASVYMLEYEDMHWNEIEMLTEDYYEMQADIARGK